MEPLLRRKVIEGYCRMKLLAASGVCPSPRAGVQDLLDALIAGSPRRFQEKKKGKLVLRAEVV